MAEQRQNSGGARAPQQQQPAQPPTAPQQQNGQELARKPAESPSTQIEKWMHDGSMMERIASALSGYLDPKTFAAQCVLAAKDPILRECTARSMFEAFLVCAQMGLLPGKHHGHVALIPRNDRETGQKNVDVMPQWQGYKFLMERQPGIKRVQAMLVHEQDDFVTDGFEVHHRFDPFDDGRQFCHPADGKDGRTGLRGGYLRIEHEDGEIRHHFVSAAKIEAARKCSQTPDMDKWGKPGVWRKWFPEQAIKTVIRDAWARRAVNIDPILADRLATADDIDNRVLGNDPSRGGYTDGTATTTAPAALAHDPHRPLPTAGMGGLKQKVGIGKVQTVEVQAERVEVKGPWCPSCQSDIGDMPPEAQAEIAQTGICPACPSFPKAADDSPFPD